VCLDDVYAQGIPMRVDINLLDNGDGGDDLGDELSHVVVAVAVVVDDLPPVQRLVRMLLLVVGKGMLAMSLLVLGQKE
jgi:hypothetical protein